MEKSSSASGGIGFAGAFFLVLLVLKLTGHLSWSWWWVTAPLWIPFLIGVLIVVGMLLCWIGVSIHEARPSTKRRRYDQIRHRSYLRSERQGKFIGPPRPRRPR